ncbi:carbohydrate ABC transporter permease [Tumebacillus permanentifrigoris]|uniref:Carbohydrate ABC transporter membrane protein 2 (CUT1 family) n=1 Tax=Tumebacillus permanentifrigoris TaxID=378543 RepID=A0A316DBQ7_9BACL|nr:carbohydrate ABC transporter permease [Tumebacillus permanentifrigoris]PWK15631.1 carbohydrate ABC transporter membrane protein 2 (CUT1 family) [Tumebacillus permanentifrigoris]
MRIKHSPTRWLTYVVLLVWAVISLLPLYWVFSTALQLPDYVESEPPKMIPMGIIEYFTHPESRSQIVTDTFSGFQQLFHSTNIWRWFFNSGYISIVVTVGILFLDTMAGYALAKKDFPGRNLIFWLIVATMMVPGQITLVPLFIMVQKFGLMNTHWALILPDLSMVFGVFLMRQYMLSIPSDLLDAAKIDGASEWKTFWTVVVPLAKPALATLGIFTFMNVWNSFLWPIIVLNDADLYTLPVGLKTLQDQNLAIFKLLMSGAAVAAVPMILVFMAFQRYFIKGLTVGGVKE